MTVDVPTMEGIDGKLRRAKEHFEAFRQKVTAHMASDTHEIAVEIDEDASEYVFRIKGIQPVDSSWSYIAGDCLHNLRSALDHLVYQLAILGQGRGLTDVEARRTMFPIFDSPDKFRDVAKSRIGLLRQDERTRITELQPFNAKDASIWAPDPGRIPVKLIATVTLPEFLQRLETLDVIDKHRLVHATWRSFQGIDAPNPPIRIRRALLNGGPLDDNAEVGRWHYADPRPPLPPDMDVKRYFPIDVSLGDLPDTSSATDLLGLLCATVESVLNIFRPCIVDGRPALPVHDKAFPSRIGTLDVEKYFAAMASSRPNDSPPTGEGKKTRATPPRPNRAARRKKPRK